MKFRNLMLGLGIGFVSLGVFLYMLMGFGLLPNQKEKPSLTDQLTDQQIISRAKDLGMVSAETIAEQKSLGNDEEIIEKAKQLGMTFIPTQNQEDLSLVKETEDSAEIDGSAATLEATNDGQDLVVQTLASAEAGEIKLEPQALELKASESTDSKSTDSKAIASEPIASEPIASASTESATQNPPLVMPTPEALATAAPLAETDTPIPVETLVPPIMTSTPAPVVTPTPAATTKPKPTAAAKPSSNPLQVSGMLTTEYFEITIPYGSATSTVGKILEQYGLVKDGKDFVDYVVDQGYSRKIYTGKRQIPFGSSYDEIIKILTTK